MHTHSHLVRISALAVGIAGALAFSQQADAAAFQLKENSAKGLGRAFAGSISAPGDASVTATNPAAMRLLDGRQFQADLSVISFGAEFDGGGRYVGPTGPGTGTPIGGGDGGDAGAIAPVPAAYFHMPFGENENMHLGVSLTVPYGFKTEYDRDWVGRYHGIKTDLRTYDLGVSFSYDVNPYVSFGASVFAERLEVDLSSAIDFGTALYAQGVPGFAPGNADGYTRIEGSSNDFGYTLGALFSVTEDTHIGLSYRSEVEHDIDDGTASFDVPGPAAAVLAVAAPGQYVDTEGRATITLPASATLSVTHRLNDQWSLMADVSRTAWGDFDQVTVDFASNQADNVLAFNYVDTTFVSVGADYRLSDTLTLRGGLAFDQTPTRLADRDVRVPDTTRRWLSLGLSWMPSQATEVSVGYTHLFTEEPELASVSATGSTLAGSYDVSGDVLAASINYKF